MRLYYLTSLPIAKLILTERRMKLSLFSELNDPFELLGASIGDKLARVVFKKILHQHWTRTLGLICFSDTWQNPVMWAHYGDKHYGICLGFDVSDDLAKKVQYEARRLKVALCAKSPSAGLDPKTLEAVLLTKFSEWAYEREWRVFSPLTEVDQNGRYYVNFGPNMRLRTVIVGARCTASLSEIGGLVSGADRPVEVWKARAAFNEFKIVRQKMIPALKLT